MHLLLKSRAYSAPGKKRFRIALAYGECKMQVCVIQYPCFESVSLYTDRQNLIGNCTPKQKWRNSMRNRTFQHPKHNYVNIFHFFSNLIWTTLKLFLKLFSMSVTQIFVLLEINQFDNRNENWRLSLISSFEYGSKDIFVSYFSHRSVRCQTYAFNHTLHNFVKITTVVGRLNV